MNNLGLKWLDIKITRSIQGFCLCSLKKIFSFVTFDRKPKRLTLNSSRGFERNIAQRHKTPYFSINFIFFKNTT